jgi:hypothetical protein
MNTLVIVLSAVLGQAGEELPGPVMQHNYIQAQKQAAQEKKPLAVFLAPGHDGLKQLIPGGIGQQAKEILSRRYIAVHVDTGTAQGQQLAKDFAIRGGQGVIISDRGGAYQAFWAEGIITNPDLVRRLQRYADITNVRMTEVAGRTSLYPPIDEPRSGRYYPPSGRIMPREGEEVYYSPYEYYMPNEGRRGRGRLLGRLAARRSR